MIPNRRHHPRIMLPVALKASFRLEGGMVADVQIDSIGLGGLGGWLDDCHQPGFEAEARIRSLCLEHPDFPTPAPELRVVFSTQAGQGPRPGQMMFGAQFLDPSEAFLSSLRAFLGQMPQR